MTDNGQHSPIERAVDALVYAPLGLALFAKDVVPPLFHQLVARGKAELGGVQERVNQQVSQAKIIGQFAVNQGGEQIKREVSQRIDEARERGEQLTRIAGIDLRRPAPVPPSRHAPVADEEAVGAPTPAAARTEPEGNASHLAIPDYDELSASQVVARLGGLDAEQLRAVADYEQARRQRKTILTKIEQLTA